MDYYSLKPKRITLLLRSHLIHKTIAVTATVAKLLSKCCCHGSKLFILVWCEVVYPHRFSVLRPCSPSARHLPARSRGLEDGSLRFLLFPSFPSLLSLISLLLALYSSLLFSSLLFSSLFFSFLLFSPFSFRGRYD